MREPGKCFNPFKGEIENHTFYMNVEINLQIETKLVFPDNGDVGAQKSFAST